MKSVSAKLEAKKVERLEKIFGSAYGGVQATTEFFFIQRNLVQKSLKGIFDRQELIALYDMHNGIMFQPEMAQKAILIATIEDSELYEGTLSNHSVDMGKITEKIEHKMTDILVFWLIFEISQFWSRNADLDEFVQRFL